MLTEVIPWLNENGLRSYPFITNTNKLSTSSYVLDNQLIVDLSLVYYASPVAATASLISIVNNGTTVSFNFSDSIVFNAALSLTGIQYIRGTNNSGITINTAFLSVIPVATSTFTNLYVEPSIVYEYYNDWDGVTSLTFAPNYETATEYFPTLPLVTASSTGLTGDLTFFAGYNFGLSFDLINNNINLEVGPSYGLPMSCTDYFIDPSLTDCSEIISYINGVPPDDTGLMTIAPGNNIIIIPGTSVADFNDGINTGELGNTHSIFIGMSLYTSELCPAQNLLPIS